MISRCAVSYFAPSLAVAPLLFACVHAPCDELQLQFDSHRRLALQSGGGSSQRSATNRRRGVNVVLAKHTTEEITR